MYELSLMAEYIYSHSLSENVEGFGCWDVLSHSRNYLKYSIVLLAGDKHASTAAVLIIEICFHFSTRTLCSSFSAMLLVSINRLYFVEDLNCKFFSAFLHCLSSMTRKIFLTSSFNFQCVCMQMLSPVHPFYFLYESSIVSRILLR